MRELVWGTVPNLRDLGGLPSPHGTTRFGRVARGPRREMFDDAARRAAAAWGLRTVVDLRCLDEVGPRDGDPALGHWSADVAVVSAPTEDHANEAFRETCFPILDSPEYWAHNLRILPELVGTALTAIASAEPGVLVHCAAGRDRTGMVVALLLGNAGVAPEHVADDYALSVRAMAGRASHGPGQDRQSTWTESEVAHWVEQVRPVVVEFASQTPHWMALMGLDGSTRSRLRSLLVDA